MADEAIQNIEDALNKIVNTTDQSGNMRKDLKKTIFETVSTLRNLFHNIKEMIDEKTKQNKHLENEVTKMNKELDNCRSTTPKGQAETPKARKQELLRTDSRQVPPPHGSNKKLYSSIVETHVETKHRVLIRSRVNQTPEMVKKLLKSNVNHTEIKVGITSLKLFRDGRVVIEANSRNEIETIGHKIEETCGAELEVNIEKRRNPILPLLRIPEDITIENAEETLAKQNPELYIKEGDIRAKFCYTTKRETRNLVMEVDSETRRKLIQARIKLGWAICRVDYYIVAKR